MKIVSVILPVYNCEKYLSQSIKSILNQTYNNIELIIINDGSTDKSIDIINYFADKDERIKVISRDNKGLVYSLNEGILYSTGEYIARMDADDVAHIDRLEKQMLFMEKNHGVDILGSYISIIGDVKDAVNAEQWFNQTWDNKYMLSRIVENTPVAHPTVVMKKEAIQNLGGYRPNYEKMEDYDLWIRAYKKGYIICNYPEKLLDYRIHQDSKSQIESNNVKEYIIERIKLKIEHFVSTDMLKNKKIYIWGCGQGGKITCEYFDEIGIQIEGFIDSFKSGSFCDKRILAVSDINKDEAEYVLIATSIGLPSARCTLQQKEYKELNDYMYII